jgi:hypothetical protein
MATKKAATAGSPIKRSPKSKDVTVAKRAVSQPAVKSKSATKAAKPVGPALQPAFSEWGMALTMASRPRDELIRNWELALALEMKPTLDTHKLAMAFRRVLSLHSRLRCVYFVRDGEVTVRTLPLEAFDLMERDAIATPEAAFLAELQEEAAQPWNMSAGPQITLTVYRRPKDRMVLLLRMNHLMVDGWSIEILLRDMIMFYLGVPSGAPAPGFDEFVTWETAFMQTHQGRDQRAFWRRKLARLSPRLKLPYDRPPTSPLINKAANAQFAFDATKMAAIRELSRRSGVSIYGFMLAVYQILLTHLSGESDLTVIATTARRNNPKFVNTIGMIANLVAFRNSVTPSATFLQQLARAGRTIIEALENQDCHIKLVGEDLAADQFDHANNFGPANSAFDQVGLYMLTPNQTGLPDAGLRARFDPDHKFKVGPFELRGLPLRRSDATRELTLFFNEVGNELMAFFAYNAELFDPPTVAGFAEKFARIADLVLERPERTVDEILAAL